RRSTLACAMARRRGSRAVTVAAAGLALLAVAAVAAPLLTPADPYAPALEERLRPPGPGHPLGQDALGRDVLARILHGARISLLVGVVTVGLSVAAGLALGAAAGYAGGWLDEVVMRGIDLLLAFPGLLLAIALAAVLGPSVRNVVLALSLLGWTGYARLVRAEVAALRRREFVHAAEALGARPGRIILRHLLPVVAPSVLVQATFGMAGAIVAESSPSLLRPAAPPPLPPSGAPCDAGP